MGAFRANKNVNKVCGLIFGLDTFGCLCIMGLTPPGGSHPRSLARTHPTDLTHPSISLLIIKSLSPLSRSLCSLSLAVVKKSVKKLKGCWLKNSMCCFLACSQKFIIKNSNSLSCLPAAPQWEEIFSSTITLWSSGFLSPPAHFLTCSLREHFFLSL